VLPGVFLLSRLRWSGFPVDFAIGFGPGLRAIVVFLKSIRANLSQNNIFVFMHTGSDWCFISI
jgi:hypothetical protein